MPSDSKHGKGNTKITDCFNVKNPNSNGSVKRSSNALSPAENNSNAKKVMTDQTFEEQPSASNKDEMETNTI